MTADYPLPAFGELLGYYRSAEAAAAARGDTESVRLNQGAAADLLAQVKPPRLLPDSLDDCLMQRRAACDMGAYIIERTQHSYGLACRQYDFAHRLNEVIARRVAE